MMDKELQEMIKYIHLSGLLKNWDTYIELAQKGNFSHVKLLKHIISEEYKIKKENSRQMRLKRAHIPRMWAMETFPFSKQPKLRRKKILTIYDSFDYISKKQNLIFIGPTGAGKSGLATAFLIQAINLGYTGEFILFPELIEMLYRSKGDLSEGKLIKKLASYDCLVIDELGYVETNPTQVGLFYTLMNKRYKQKSTVITSNLGFSEWTSFLKNDQLTAALIDRLTEDSHVISMKNCVSLRPKLASMS